MIYEFQVAVDRLRLRLPELFSKWQETGDSAYLSEMIYWIDNAQVWYKYDATPLLTNVMRMVLELHKTGR